MRTGYRFHRQFASEASRLCCARSVLLRAGNECAALSYSEWLLPENSEGCKYVQHRVWNDKAGIVDALRKDAVFFLYGAAKGPSLRSSRAPKTSMP
ncbi:hypothetical protein C8J57DRAFT_1391389 [Mycena rebaudengoi]|nr:hypothetical protein C8J57DRAFT_1391389 [Mycena rebaudengoi]